MEKYKYEETIRRLREEVRKLQDVIIKVKKLLEEDK